MVQRQHRIPSHPPSKSENSEVQVAAVRRREPPMPGINGLGNPGEFENGLDETVGRRAPADGWLQAPQKIVGQTSVCPSPELWEDRLKSVPLLVDQSCEDAERSARNGRNRKNPLPFFFPFDSLFSAVSSSFFFAPDFLFATSSLFFTLAFSFAASSFFFALVFPAATSSFFFALAFPSTASSFFFSFAFPSSTFCFFFSIDLTLLDADVEMETAFNSFAFRLSRRPFDSLERATSLS